MEEILSGKGILPSQAIRQLLERQHISSIGAAVSEDQIQPSSIDLRLGPKAFQLKASFLPRSRSSVMDMVTSRDLLKREINLTQPAELEPNEVYVVPLLEKLALPQDIGGIANPKSTTGRLDIFTRLITESRSDHVEFERVAKGYKGPLYLEIASRTFRVLIQEGMKLNQLRFLRGRDEPLGQRPLKEAEILYREHDQAEPPDIRKRGLQITVDLEGDSSDIVAYQAKKDAPILNLLKIDHYDIGDYWIPLLRPTSGQIILYPGEFYILASKEKVRVPNDLAAEMIPYDPAMGEFRVHYAGFFDPGFGYGASGEIPGSRAVLEVRVYEVPFLLEHGRMVGRLNYYSMVEPPDKIYGGPIGSNYQRQGLTLAKQFRMRRSSGNPTPEKREFRLVPANMQPVL